MMPPNVACLDADTVCMDHEPVASEAEGEDLLIDVVGVHQTAAGLSASKRTPSAAYMQQSPPIMFSNIGLGHHTVGGKKYHCQRCLNHGLEIPRKGHKRECQYTECICDDCKLVEKRKILNREINSERERLCTASPIIITVSVDQDGPLSKVRNPRCARCRAHDPEKEPPPLKGHKKACRYKHCECKKCSLITCRRDVMAKQIRLRRKQKSKNGESGSTSTNGKSPTMTATPIEQPLKFNTGGTQLPCVLAREPSQKQLCVDLVTPPISESTRDSSDLNASTFSSGTATKSPNAMAIRPRPTYPMAMIQQQGPVVECCILDSPPVHMPNGNPFAQGPGQFSNDIQPALCPDLPTANTGLCPQALLAGFVQYVNAVVNAAAVGRHSQPATNPGGGLTLPTMPAQQQSMHLNQAMAMAAASHQRHPRSPAEMCAIPFCFPGSNHPHASSPNGLPTMGMPQQFQAQQCFLNDHHQRMAMLASNFGQAMAQAPTHMFHLP